MESISIWIMDFKKIILVFCCFAFSLRGVSQDSSLDFTMSHGVYVRYGAITKMVLHDWQAFADSYNTVYAPSQKLGDFKTLVSYDFGYRFTYNSVYTSLSYQHYLGRASSVFVNNESREFDLFSNSISWGFGARIGKPDSKVGVSPFLNLRFGDRTRIESAYIYADGFHSRGSEKSFNGTYAGQGLGGNELGVLIQIKAGSHFVVEVEMAKMWANWLQPSVMNDHTQFKIDGLPQDNAAYLAGPLDYTLESKEYVHDQISATKLMVGLSYKFSNQ